MVVLGARVDAVVREGGEAGGGVLLALFPFSCLVIRGVFGSGCPPIRVFEPEIGRQSALG